MWISPDGNVTKILVVEGVWGKKPSEQTECEIVISDCPESFLEYCNSTVVIGDSDSYIRRTLDICLGTMNEGESAKFEIMPDDIRFTIKLLRIDFKGYIHEWTAKTKLELAQNHKEKGVTLFKQDRHKDAAYRFAKALKIIHSIPINVENPPQQIDNIPLSDITKLKANLYNNLASYYLKREAWQLTMDSCQRVLQYDGGSVKAHYKLAVACMKEKNLERAKSELGIVLAAEPDNKAAIEQMRIVQGELHQAEAKFNSMVKKMFG